MPPPLKVADRITQLYERNPDAVGRSAAWVAAQVRCNILTVKLSHSFRPARRVGDGVLAPTDAKILAVMCRGNKRRKCAEVTVAIGGTLRWVQGRMVAMSHWGWVVGTHGAEGGYDVTEAGRAAYRRHRASL